MLKDDLPLHRQLEALAEAALGDDTRANLMRAAEAARNVERPSTDGEETAAATGHRPSD